MVQIGIAAYSGPPPQGLASKARRLVQSLANECNPVLVLGGYRGLMKLVVDEALSRGLGVILVLPREYEDDLFPNNVMLVKTGMDTKARSDILVRSSDVLVALGGASGTLVEILMAYGLGKPVYLLVDTGMPSDNLSKAYPDGILDPRIAARIFYSSSPEEIARMACRASWSSR